MPKIGSRLIESAREAFSYVADQRRDGFVVHKPKKKVDASKDSKRKVKGHGFQPCR